MSQSYSRNVWNRKSSAQNQDPNQIQKRLMKDLTEIKEINLNKKMRFSINDQYKKILDVLKTQDGKQLKKKKENLIKMSLDKVNKKQSINISVGEFQKVLERMRNLEKKANDNKKIMMEDNQKSKLKECTFIPLTGKNNNSKSFEHFLKQQENFKIEKQKNIQRQQEIKNLNVTQSLRLNISTSTNSKKILSNAKHKKRNCESFHSIRNQKELSFKPQILKQSKEINRGQSIQQILYKDAKRREKQKKQKIEQENSIKQSIQYFNSKQSFQSFIQKFQKEFQKSFDYLNHNQHTHLLPGECFLAFRQFTMILQQLRYIRQYDRLGEPEKIKIDQLWQIMGGKQYNGISKIKLKKSLLTIEGIIQDKNILHLQNKKSFSKQILNFENMNWQDTDHLICFKNQFKIFNANKKSNFQRNIVDYNDFNFKPDILKVSSKMADNHRKKFFEDNQNEKQVHNINLINYFDLDKKNVDKKKLVKKNMKEKEQIKQCTFKPQINKIQKNRKSSKASSIITSQRDSHTLNDKQQKQPIFSLQVNIKNKNLEKILIYQDDIVEDVITKLKQKYNINDTQAKNFEKIISENLKLYKNQSARQK